jgi:hypothetical protein
MIPRVVQMAKEVSSVFSDATEKELGNVIYNGYVTVVPNTVNKKAWQYKETLTAPVDLPSLTVRTPAMKGWTNNYQEYFTQLGPVPGYDVTSGDPTMFEYSVHSFLPSGAPKWAQPPHRRSQLQVLPFTPPNYNPAAIQYSGLYPVADNPVPPPIDSL